MRKRKDITAFLMVCIIADRYLAGDSLERIGLALSNAAALAKKTILAYMEEIQLQGQPSVPF